MENWFIYCNIFIFIVVPYKTFSYIFQKEINKIMLKRPLPKRFPIPPVWATSNAEEYKQNLLLATSLFAKTLD